jgi:hypothetical protein
MDTMCILIGVCCVFLGILIGSYGSEQTIIRLWLANDRLEDELTMLEKAIRDHIEKVTPVRREDGQAR